MDVRIMGGRGAGSGSGRGAKLGSITVSQLTVGSKQKMFTVRATFADGSNIREAFTTSKAGTGLWHGATEVRSADSISLNGTPDENKAKVGKIARSLYATAPPKRVEYGSKG